MQLNRADIEYLVNTIDSHLRANGLKAAQTAIVVGSKLQTMAKTAPEATAPEGAVVSTPPPDPDTG